MNLPSSPLFLLFATTLVIVDKSELPSVNSKHSHLTYGRKHIQGDLKKRDTEIFEEVSIYEKILSQNEFHFLMHSMILQLNLDNVSVNSSC